MTFRATSTFSDNALENSNLAHLTRRNEETLPAEAATLKGMIDEYSECMTALDSRVVNLGELQTTFLQQVSLIDNEVEHILAEREKLSDAINFRKKLLSLVRSLPSGILCRIFYETVREVVLSFPELCSYLNVIVTDNNFFMRTYRYMRLLSRQLARSKQHRLTVMIHRDAEESNSHELPEALIAPLFSASERIQVLFLAMFFAAFSSLPPLRLSFPSLST